MTATFLYALPENTSLQQEAAIARGLHGRFPSMEFECRDGAFLTGDIIPMIGRTDPLEPDQIAIDHLPHLLVLEVKTAFAELLIDALASA